MKTISLIILIVLSHSLLAKNIDSLNFYILNGVDTTYVKSWTQINQCNYLLSTEKSHNKCRIFINNKPYSGKITYQYENKDSTLVVFDGEFNHGFIETGTILRYSKLRQLILSGQYEDNWKFGIWTTYFDTGEIESVAKFIKGADEPVIEWEYDKSGRQGYYNNEQQEVEERIRNAR